MILEKLKNIFKSSQPPPVAEEEQEEGYLTHLQVKPPFIKGFQRKYLYILAGCFSLLLAGALFWGLEEKPKTEAVPGEQNTESSSGPQPIEGSHMLNIPKNYTEKAVKDAKEQKDDRPLTKFDRPKHERFAEPLPQTGRDYRKIPAGQLPPRERGGQSVENKQQKALESPIRFEIKE